MLLSIVTINYKKADLTIDCIRSLYKNFLQEFKRNVLELIIVDNASDDGSVQKLNNEIKKNKYTNIKVIAMQENAGFSKGCNIGAKNTNGKYVLFLNNDTLIMDKGILKMVKYMERNSEVSILGGQLRKHNGEEQPSTGGFYTLFNTFLLLMGLQTAGVLDRSPDKISEVDWVKGALLMIRKDVFKKLLGFDEKIFMYTEDMELCYRAKKLGYKTFFYPDILVFHEDHGSSNRTFAVVQIYKGLLYFYKKHRSYLEYALVKTMLYVKAGIAIVIGFLTGNRYLTTTFRKAIQF